MFILVSEALISPLFLYLPLTLLPSFTLKPGVWASPPGMSQIPAGCQAITLSSDTVYLEMTLEPQVRAPSHKTAQEANLKSRLSPVILITSYKSEVPTAPSSDFVIC